MQVRRYRVGGWPDEWCELRLVETTDDLLALRNWVAARVDQVLALDCETNALDPWQPGFRTRMVQISDGAVSWAVPIWEGLFSGLRREQVAKIVWDCARWVAHFAEADERFLCRGLGLDWDPVRWADPEPHFWDTQVMLAVHDPRTVTTYNKMDRIHPRIPRPRGLKEVTARLLTPALAAAEADLHARFRELAPVGQRTGRRMVAWGFANIPTDDPAYLLYATLDPLLTARLYRLLRRDLEARGQWARTEAALAEQWMVDRATYQGLPIDEEYARRLDADLARVAAEQATVLTPHGIGESGQGPAVGAAFAALGVRSPKVDQDTGKERWDREALAALVERGREFLAARPGPISTDQERRAAQAVRLAEAVLAARRANKYRSTWVAPMLWACEHADGASHPSVRAVGTVTTRMSCHATPTAGPLHSAPKREETRLRACYRAPRGWLYVSADLRQGEPYVMAALSGDPDYLAHLEAGDINGRLAAELYGGAYDPAQGKVGGTASYQMRQACKFAWLAACYGAGPGKVDALLGLPGSGVLDRWRAAYPRFWSYADECNRLGAVRLDSGHVIPLWDRWWVDDDGELRPRTDRDGQPVNSRLGLNAATQGTQSDVLRVAMHRHRHDGWAWALRFFLHDELLGMVPAPLAEPYRDYLERAMTVRYRGVTISAEAEVCGPTWEPQEVGAVGAADLAALDEDNEEANE